MRRRGCLAIAIVALLLLFGSSVVLPNRHGGVQRTLANTASQAIAPGDTLHLTCSTALHGGIATQTADVSCDALPTPTPTATPVPTATATPLPPTATNVPPTATPIPSLVLPIRAAFFYPWFPGSWTQGGVYPWTHYTPSKGFYDSQNAAVIAAQIGEMQSAHIQAGIASWWGQGTPTDTASKALLAAPNNGFKWALYHEGEGQGNPSVASIQSDIAYILTTYASDPDYLRVNGKPVLFVYDSGAATCEMPTRWAQANAGRLYLVLKVFNGYKLCADQPDSWHQYGPAAAVDSQAGYSYTISPGFWRDDEATPRLTRDLTRWNTNIRAMIASNAPWQLVTTFNEWGEGTQIEPSTQLGRAELDALAANGVVSGTPTAVPATATPAPTGTAQPTATSTPGVTPTSASGGVVIAAAGDIASCSSTGDTATAALVAALPSTTTVLTLGDNEYDAGTAAEFANCYQPTWGAFKARTRPSPGNHDYGTPGAAGYLNYFGVPAYYAYDLGNGWRGYALDSAAANCCDVTSAQYAWLQADLDAHPGVHILAYWHHPRYTSGSVHPDTLYMDSIWDLLVAHHADLVLSGHNHNYERFQPIGANDEATAAGITEIIVGTGGKDHAGFATSKPLSVVRNNTAFGVLKVTLYPDHFDWLFIPVAGQTFTDSGTRATH